MGPKNRGLLVRRALIVFSTAVIASVIYAQTTQKSPSHHSKSTVAHSTRSNRALQDSLAAARADSIQKAQGRIAVEDSLARLADSLAQTRRADSLRTHELRKIKNDAFDVGERLVFDVNYGFITAGEAVMQVAAYDTVEGRRCFRIEFQVNSLPSFSWIYRVEDRYLTYIDVQTIAPWKFEQHVREGSYRRDFTAVFDQVHNVARTSEGTYPIPPYVHDILSAFYFARTIDMAPLKVGDLILLSNFYKDKAYDLAVKVLGRQELEVAAGTFNTVVVEPLVKEGGLFKSEGRIVIWLTDDERKIPVRVNTKVVVGSIDTELREYSGIRGPIRARVK
ncbi:MAG TPA: DUF3108 domain-containing protein [Bacteroidota bacterium]|nr:DUF3108 domain-containing protein [Bacteroidota bacterium]